MEKTRFLTESEKQKGVFYISQFQALNGLGFSFLGDTTVYLLAIFYGATNIQLGYISSAVFLSGILLPLVPRLTAGKSIVKVLSTAWILRGLVCIGYLFLYFLEGQPAVLLILTIYTAFAMIRTAGVVMFRPIMRMISSPSNQGEVYGKITAGFQISSIFSRAASFVITSFQQLSGVVGLLGLQILGVVFNTVASLQARKIPCRETVEYKKGRGVFSQLKRAFNSSRLRLILILHWLCIAMQVLANLSIPFVRNRIGLPTSQVFLYSMGITLATIGSSLFVKTFSDRISIKPLMTISTIGAFAFTAAWALVPETLIHPIYYLLGFFLMFTVNNSRMLIGRMIISVMPEDDVIGFNSMIDFIVALISLVLGILGGWLIDFGPTAGSPLFNQYSLTFALSGVVSLIIVLLVLRVEERNEMSGRDAMALLFSVDGLRTFMHISRLEKVEDPVRRKTMLISIGSSRTDAATEKIRDIFLLPFSPEKVELIRSLFYNPRESLLDSLIRDAENPDSYTRDDSLFALGAYPGDKAEAVLIRLLYSSSPRTRAIAAKSLGRVGNTAHLEEIKKRWCEEKAIENKLNYTIALSHMDKSGEYLLELFSSCCSDYSNEFLRTLFSFQADMLYFVPALSQMYQGAAAHDESGLGYFIDETRNHPLFLEHHRVLKDSFAGKDYAAIGRVLLAILDEHSQSGKHSGNSGEEIAESGQLYYLGKAVRNFLEAGKGVENPDYLLAMFYFTYQVVKPV